MEKWIDMEILPQVIQVLANLGILTFVIASMAALGLSLTIKQIVEPLRNVRLLAAVLLANFVLTPALALLLKLLIPMNEGYGIGLLLLATAAGAPFLPKLVQVAKGDVPLSVGMMVLLMVVTILYAPLMLLPLLLPGVQVNPLDIATSLVVLMLIPLAIGLFVKARYDEMAANLQPAFAQISNVGLMLGFVALLVISGRTLLDAIGSGAIVAVLLLIVGAFLIGWLLAGKERGARVVMGLGAAQRNVSAAFVIAGSNFSDPDVLILCMVGALLMLGALMFTAGELGKRAPAKPSVAANMTPAPRAKKPR
jgi:BASS family bile acid:Na+ symporter